MTSADSPIDDPSPTRWLVSGLISLAVVAILVWLDMRLGWVAHSFDALAHLFFEMPVLAKIRRPSQVPLVRMHLLTLGSLTGLGLVCCRWFDRHGRRWLALFLLAYAVRATIWVVGSNLPLVPGDSCHYVEVATSVWRGEGAVKHYVESFFSDYPPIREGKGVLDDWATPLYGYVVAGAFRLSGVDPVALPESALAVAKGTSFVLNLLCLPMLYGFARRSVGREAGLVAMGLLAILPVHALYAGFELRESLVALTSIAAIWALFEMGKAEGGSRWLWAIAAGCLGGSAILARNTAMALLAGGVVFTLWKGRRRAVGPLIVWGVFVSVVVAPWAWATYQAYGEPFHTYTKYFQYTFSWTVHHYQEGKPSAAGFYTWANAGEIVRTKLKALTIIVVTSTMILSLPLMAAWLGRLRSKERSDVDVLALILSLAFVGGTLANVADITQVSQLGRYYLPLFCLLLPSAAAGLMRWFESSRCNRKYLRPLALGLFALLWSDPTWAYDYSWLVKPYQLHWAGLKDAGDWVKAHPDAVPRDARIMTWFPWEFRVSSDRTTILLPRNYQADRIEQVIRQYGVTHLLWGSFETPPNADPETFGPYLEQVKLRLGLNERNEIYRSPPPTPFPVRLYRLRGGSR